MEQENIIERLEAFKKTYSEFINGVEKVFVTVNAIIAKTGFTEDLKILSIDLSELKIQGIKVMASNLNSFKDDLNKLGLGSMTSIL